MPPRKCDVPPPHAECIGRPVLLIHSPEPGGAPGAVDWLAILLERTARGASSLRPALPAFGTPYTASQCLHWLEKTALTLSALSDFRVC